MTPELAHAAVDVSEMPQWILVVLGFLGFVVTIIITTGAVVWTASNTRVEMQTLISKNKEDTDQDIADMKADVTTRFTTVYMQSNQELQSLRQETTRMSADLLDKLRQTEIFIRDEFVRKETFNMVIDRIIGEVKAMAADVAQRVVRLETKLDNAISRRIVGPVKPEEDEQN